VTTSPDPVHLPYNRQPRRGVPADRLQTLARIAMIAALGLRLALTFDDQPWPVWEVMVPLLFMVAIILAALALMGQVWTAPRRITPLGALVSVGLLVAVVGRTGGPESWYMPGLVLYPVMETAFHARSRAWVITGAAVAGMCAPLFYDFRPEYLVTLSLASLATIAGTYYLGETVAETALTRTETQQLEAVARASRLSLTVDLRETLEGRVDIIRELMAPTACLLYLAAEDEGLLRPAHVYLDPGHYTSERHRQVWDHAIPLGAGLLGQATRIAEPVLVPDFGEAAGRVPIPGLEAGPQTQIIVPLTFGDRTLGALRIVRSGRGQYDQEDLTLASIFANQAAAAIANSRLFEQTALAERSARHAQQRYDRLTAHAGHAVFAVKLPEGTVTALNRAAEELFGYKLADYDADPTLPAKMLHPDYLGTIDETVRSLEAGSPSVRDVLLVWKDRAGREITVEHTFVAVHDEGGALVGMESICRDITKQREMEEHIRRLSFHDQLTGTHNRAYFEEQLRRLDAERDTPVSIILADINGLKLANDGFGHDAGDRLLRQAARLIRSALRRKDEVFRWGGDEFAVILRGIDERRAGEISARIRAAVSSAKTTPIPLSIALGYASRSEQAPQLAAVLKLAEDRMYRDKLLQTHGNQGALLNALLQTLGERTGDGTGETAQRLKSLGRQLGQVLGLSEDQLSDLELLAVMHDLGKVGIPEHILEKPDVLSPEEWEIVKRHPETGYRIARASLGSAQVAELILTHRERWDGSGYPRGLVGEEIPLASRIFAVVDAYAAMTQDRPYRMAMSHRAAVAELVEGSGKQFDADVVAAFVAVLDEGRRLRVVKAKD